MKEFFPSAKSFEILQRKLIDCEVSFVFVMQYLKAKSCHLLAMKQLEIFLLSVNHCQKLKRCWNLIRWWFLLVLVVV